MFMFKYLLYKSCKEAVQGSDILRSGNFYRSECLMSVFSSRLHSKFHNTSIKTYEQSHI